MKRNMMCECYRVSALSGGRERKIMKFVLVRWEESE
jgi:hypothetical protein